MNIIKGVNRQFTNELERLLNKYGVDTLVGVQDFVLAHTIERILNALAWQNEEVIRLRGSGMEDEII